MKTFREQIREVYYDWANMPKFERKEKYPKDERVEDSFIRIFADTILKIIGEDEPQEDKTTISIFHFERGNKICEARNKLREELKASLLKELGIKEK